MAPVRRWLAVTRANSHRKRPGQGHGVACPMRACSCGAEPNRSSRRWPAESDPGCRPAIPPSPGPARSHQSSPGIQFPHHTLAPMPVRLRIQSSLVSTRSPSSMLLMARDGRLPHPPAPPAVLGLLGKAMDQDVASVNHNHRALQILHHVAGGRVGDAEGVDRESLAAAVADHGNTVDAQNRAPLAQRGPGAF